MEKRFRSRHGKQVAGISHVAEIEGSSASGGSPSLAPRGEVAWSEVQTRPPVKTLGETLSGLP